MNYEKARIFRQFQGKSLDDFIVNDDNRKAYDATVEFIDRMVPGSLDDPRGILYAGPPGVGKTFLAMMCAKAAVDNGQATLCYTMENLIELIKRGFRLEAAMAKDADVGEEWVSNYKRQQYLRTKAQVLVLDDAGKEYGTDNNWATGQFNYIFRHRWNAGLCTILTSNVPVSKWDSQYSESMQSFVHEACQVVKITGEDRR